MTGRRQRTVAVTTSGPSSPLRSVLITTSIVLLAIATNAAQASPADNGGDADAGSPPILQQQPEEPVIEGLSFTDIDNGCNGEAGFPGWMDYEMKTGEEETDKSNREVPTNDGLEFKGRIAPRLPGMKRFTLLCITYTYVKANHKGAKLHNTWGKHCTRHVIVTNQGPIEGVPDEDVLEMTPEGGEHNDNLWRKTRAIIERLSRKDGGLADYDFYFMGGDDVTMFPPNLQYAFNEPAIRAMAEAGAPMFFGTRFVSPPSANVPQLAREQKELLSGYNLHGEFLSGSGYMFTAPVVQLLANAFKRGHCWPEIRHHAEDVYFAKCLEEQNGVYTRDTKDAQGEDRVIVMTSYHMANQARDPAYTWWFRDFKPWQAPRGKDIQSRHLFQYHYTPPFEVDRLVDLLLPESQTQRWE